MQKYFLFMLKIEQFNTKRRKLIFIATIDILELILQEHVIFSV